MPGSSRVESSRERRRQWQWANNGNGIATLEADYLEACGLEPRDRWLLGMLLTIYCPVHVSSFVLRRVAFIFLTLTLTLTLTPLHLCTFTASCAAVSHPLIPARRRCRSPQSPTHPRGKISVAGAGAGCAVQSQGPSLGMCPVLLATLKPCLCLQSPGDLDSGFWVS